MPSLLRERVVKSVKARDPNTLNNPVTMPTIRFLACLIVLPVVTSLAVGARRAPAPKALAGRPTNGKAAVCQRLGLEQEEHAAAPFKTNGRCAPPFHYAHTQRSSLLRMRAHALTPLHPHAATSLINLPLLLLTCDCPACSRHVFNHEQWYECSEPATDPMMTCILAPEWMELEEGTWLCSDALKSDEKTVRNSYGEDSY